MQIKLYHFEIALPKDDKNVQDMSLSPGDPEG
jgi:hypothetical protein